MPQPYRLGKGGRIDRNKPVKFHFNGQIVEGFAGDTVASALLANGERLVSRSFKYHRPRGIFSAGSDEPNALLHVDRGSRRIDPNNRATVVEVFEGLNVKSQNHWPSLQYDVGAVNDWLSPIFTAGFYYKTFMWPRSFWSKFYEPLLRMTAGLGVAPATEDPDYYLHNYVHCDVLIVGGGPAGLAAALSASDGKKRVILVDEQMEFGGTLLHDIGSTVDGVTAEEWATQAIKTLVARDNCTLLRRTTAFGFYNHNFIALVERITDHLSEPSPDLPRERLWQVRAKEVVLASGAHERSIVFPDNDRPGIMLAESVRTYLNRYAVTPGHNIVFVTTGASAYRAAADVQAAGIQTTVVDLREESLCGPELQMLRSRNVEVMTGQLILGTTGRKRVTGLVVAKMGADVTSESPRKISCDCIGISGGWTPAVHLFSQSRGLLRWDTSIDAYVPGAAKQRTRAAGAANGNFDLKTCLEEGWQAGMSASAKTKLRSFDVTPATETGNLSNSKLPSVGDATKGKAFIDFQNDVTLKDVSLALREGFQSIEHVKRYTTAGMATDQGKTSNMAVIDIVAKKLARPASDIGTTTYRPPYTPVSFGAVAGAARGKLFDPVCKTPIDPWSETRGAIFEDVGLWRRARYYPRATEDMQTAVNRECKAVRQSAGIFDASTLGKIEVVGQDAAEFMNRIYINNWTKLGPGRCRYGVLLREDGFIFDDGVVARIAPDHFHVTTTTGGAQRVLAHMEEFVQTEWAGLKVFLTSITEQWAVIAVQGPKSREIIAPLAPDIDFSTEAFPHMAVRMGHICSTITRLFRVSFTGELGYEINIPAGDALRVWNAIWDRGKSYGLTPYGTEAMHVLRAERGFIIVGQETDGTVSPDDAGLGGMIGKSKPDFIGKRSLSLPALVASGRKQLVGLRTENPALVLEEGAQVVVDPHHSTPVPILGHVTSSYWSANCQHSIALAMIAEGRALTGRSLYATTTEGFAEVKVTNPSFIDPNGTRAST